MFCKNIVGVGALDVVLAACTLASEADMTGKPVAETSPVHSHRLSQTRWLLHLLRHIERDETEDDWDTCPLGIFGPWGCSCDIMYFCSCQSPAAQKVPLCVRPRWAWEAHFDEAWPWTSLALLLGGSLWCFSKRPSWDKCFLLYQVYVVDDNYQDIPRPIQNHEVALWSLRAQTLAVR